MLSQLPRPCGLQRQPMPPAPSRTSSVFSPCGTLPFTPQPWHLLSGTPSPPSHPHLAHVNSLSRSPGKYPFLWEASLAHQVQVAFHLLVPIAPFSWASDTYHTTLSPPVCLYSTLAPKLCGSRNSIHIACLCITGPEAVAGTQ